MMESKSQIFILSGPIQSGKTTAVYEWSRAKKSVGGFLTPDMDGLRYVFLPSMKRWIPFETKDTSDDKPIASIGKFRFHQSAFDTMEKVLIDDLRSAKEWVVIDELGKLEVAGKGLAEVAERALRMVKSKETKSKLILVVREELLDKVVNYFSIGSYLLLKIKDFENDTDILTT